MIVKIQIVPQIENETKKGWVFYDYVEHIKIYQEEKLGGASFDTCTDSFLMTNDMKTIGRMFISRVFPGGSRHSLEILIDLNEVYLLSDEGKTVERIN